ncbi:GTPase Era [Thermus scotoductus]|jgi:GTP-binding protein Era|uniref:GTPase Era n=1 Tax=Thermus scotoductus TaxID=37636 RepID=A0A430QWG5_THESC|nr:GTPase Era [Thermus scotoductus]RTG92382.1 GTPase Era [Thermus scotoductus]RTG92694.1 GTPase Era [Thermus scotoductus]RTG94019.1 GTPase Era [Thermus scotoductus]RTG99443.1 GTPase Era [Thermus scotoductus]RTG99867.1 GTPase Era [Thermus scotoductus]
MEEKTYSGFVAIVGKPNVGKSTLLNNLLGVKVAPISPRPQTTRKRLRGILTEGNRQIVFVDTPGLHKPMDALGEFMDQEVYEALSDVNAVVWVVDLRHPPTPEDELVAKALKPLVGKVPILLVGNKLDAAKYPEEALKAYHALLPEAEARMLSALDEHQVAELKAELLALLPEGPFFYPEDFAKSDQDFGEWVAEIIREEAMKRLWHEVPYAVAVKTEEVAERENGILYIKAVLYVERPSQKAIVIGEGGRKIKEIGQAARKQLEVFLNRQVYLDLEVKVYPDWRKDPEALRELGYRSSIG